MENYKYFKFSGKPNTCTQLTVAEFEGEESLDVTFSAWVFPDDTEFTVTVPDGGSVAYIWIGLNTDDAGSIEWVATAGEGSGFGVYDPETNELIGAQNSDSGDLKVNGVYRWTAYSSFEPGDPETDKFNIEGSPAGDVLEDIYFCTQSTLDFWVSAGKAVVAQADDSEQPADPDASETPETPDASEAPAESEAPAAPPATGTAYPSTQTVDVDGNKVEFQMYALRGENGNPTNYVKVRDLALALNETAAQFNVDWDGAVLLQTGTAYTPNGSENSTPFSGERAYKAPNSPTSVNGETSDLQAIMLTDDEGGGYTYYQLRDLGRKLGFNVDWNQEKGVFIETDKPYSGT